MVISSLGGFRATVLRATPAGDTIIKEGDDDRSLFKFYIVEEGEARAYVHEDGEDVLMSHLHPGDHFGEKALVEKTPRTATVKAHGPLKCAALSIAGFERLMRGIVAYLVSQSLILVSAFHGSSLTTKQGPCEDILTTAYNNPADVKTGRQTPRGGA
ncbi:unnamed protein product [Ectocarpus sp. CCAP 1310/34]|nr:unnamed protein product [Ectocarpus sp. CCAP 1310/34]